MRRVIFTYFMVLMVGSLSAESYRSVADSIGRRIEDGKLVILHKVEVKQTVYAISKIYNVSTESIYDANPTAKESLKVGQIIKIRTNRIPGSSAAKQPQTPVGSSNKTHKVQKGETLYAISKKYGRSVSELKTWNNLTSNELSLGQTLIVGKSGQNNTVAVKASQSPTGGAVHKVEKGQTLYSVSKIYNVSVDDIKRWNNLKSYSLEVGQYLKVSGSSASSGSGSNSTPANISTSSDGFHTVKKGETLYSISKLYGVTSSDITKWNNLSSSALSTGQLLVVSGKSSSSSSAMDALNAVNSDTKNGNTKTSSQSGSNASSSTNYSSDNNASKSDGDHHSVEEALAESQRKLEEHKEIKKEVDQHNERVKSGQGGVWKDADHWKVPSNISTYEDSVKYGVRSKRVGVGKYGKIVETGVCELIEDNHWDSKYNCLHHEAEKGTIIQVRNPENNISVFVRVVGRLAEDSKAPHRIIRISHHAVERLAPARSRFAVEISYLP